MKKRRKLIGVIAAGAILLLGAGYTVFIAPRLKEEKWVYIESVVERGLLAVGVTESGSLDYGITSICYDLDLDVSSEEEEDDDDEPIQKYLKVEEVYVAAGQRIQTGDRLLTFTEESVNGVRKLLESALINAKSAYNEAEAEYNLAVLEADTDYEVKKIAEKYANSIYRNTNRSIDGEIAMLRIEIQQRTDNIPNLEESAAEAEESYREAAKAYEAAKEYLAVFEVSSTGGFMEAQSSYLSAQTKYYNAESTLTQAKENFSDNGAQIASLQAELTVALAKRDIDRMDVEEVYLEDMIRGENAQVAYDAALEGLKENLQEEEKALQKIQEQLDAFEAFVGADGTLYADGEGMITGVGCEAGEKLVESRTLISYAAPEDMTITVDVTQEDVVALTVGNEVDIQFNAYPNAVYKGRILSINTTATARQSATISYETVIGVEGDTDALRGGMTADITFVTEAKEDVLYVSRKAMVEQDGRTYVYVKSTFGGQELREVQTGIRNGTSIEILSGLEEGETIYIASRVSGDEVTQMSGQEENAAFPWMNNGNVPANGGTVPGTNNGGWPGNGGAMPWQGNGGWNGGGTRQ